MKRGKAEVKFKLCSCIQAAILLHTTKDKKESGYLQLSFFSFDSLLKQVGKFKRSSFRVLRMIGLHFISSFETIGRLQLVFSEKAAAGTVRHCDRLTHSDASIFRCLHVADGKSKESSQFPSIFFHDSKPNDELSFF